MAESKFKILKSQFLKDGVALVSGNAWAQLIAFAAYLLLTRLFTPKDIGLYNIFYSYIDVLIIVSTLRYELAVVLADNDHEAAAVSRLALKINSIISVTMLTLMLLMRMLMPELCNKMLGDNLLIALLIPPMVFFCGTSRVYDALFNRYKIFKQIALSEVIGSSSGVLFKILFGFPKLVSTLWHTIGLPLGTVLGKAASNINFLLHLKRLPLPSKSTRQERGEAARKYRNFPLYTMPKDLINSFSYNLPFLWLALYFDKAEVGLFSLALTFTFRPANIFNNAFERLLYVRIAEKVRAGITIKKDIVRFAKWLNIIALPVFVVFFIFPDQIFGFLFGGRWAGCGYYIRCLLPWIYIMLTSTSLMFISNIFYKQRTEFIFYIVLLLLRIVAVVVGIHTGNFRLAIMLFAAAGAIISLALLSWYIYLINNYETSAK
ncbi:MAG: lipopolysaccharide biosynthesis protein [Bacteroidales bacterium]|nr:lipopolysaccharide biosynthesis protein [Bacteroidales bacterium]